MDPELDIAVAIAGRSALQKTGAGTMRFSGTRANTYSGLTTVNGGILALNKTPGVNAIPATLTIGGGTVRLDAANQIADASTVTVSGGALDLQTNNEAVSTVTLADGSIAGSGGTLTATAGAFDVRRGSVSAKLSGTVGLTKTTADTVTLSTANTYTGGTTINAGTLEVGAGASLKGNVSVSSGGRFQPDNPAALESTASLTLADAPGPAPSSSTSVARRSLARSILARPRRPKALGVERVLPPGTSTPPSLAPDCSTSRRVAQPPRQR